MNKENNDKLPSKDEVLMNEDKMINNLLRTSNFKEDEQYQRKVQIKRNGEDIAEFWIRPLTEKEIQECRKQASKYRQDPRGKLFGKIEIEIDAVKFRSYKILMATVDKGSGILWDNEKLKDGLGVLHSIDVIDKILIGGEKDRIADLIDEISGFGTDEVGFEEVAKN